MANEDAFENLNLVKESAPPPSSANDKITQQEQDHLFDQRDREHQVKKLFHNLLLSAIRIVFIIIVIVFLIRVAHFVMPVSWHWLTPEDLQSIDKFFFCGALGGLLSRHLNKIIK